MRCGHNQIIILDVLSEDPNTPVVKCGVCGAIYTNAEVQAEEEAENSLERQAPKAFLKLTAHAKELRVLAEATHRLGMHGESALFNKMANQVDECVPALYQCCKKLGYDCPLPH